MELALPFSAADAARIESHAARNHMSVFDFVRQSVMARIDDDEAREARNAEYLAMLDRGFQDIKEGKGTLMTWEQLETLRNE